MGAGARASWHAPCMVGARATLQVWWCGGVYHRAALDVASHHARASQSHMPPAHTRTPFAFARHSRLHRIPTCEPFSLGNRSHREPARLGPKSRGGGKICHVRAGGLNPLPRARRSTHSPRTLSPHNPRTLSSPPPSIPSLHFRRRGGIFGPMWGRPLTRRAKLPRRTICRRTLWMRC
jgi:hypothetical protein